MSHDPLALEAEPETLARLLSNLSPETLALVVPRVSKKWWGISNDERLWSLLCRLHFELQSRDGPDEALTSIEEPGSFKLAWRRLVCVNKRCGLSMAASARGPGSLEPDIVTWPLFQRAAATWGRIHAWCATHSPEIGGSLRPGAGATALEELEAFVKCRVPVAVKALLRFHDGQEILTLTLTLTLNGGAAPLPRRSGDRLRHAGAFKIMTARWNFAFYY